MNLRYRLGRALLTIAIGICVILGSLGWFAVGFGIMTDCTNNYSCTTSGCPPCAITSRWITAGAIVQWLLAGVGVAFLLVRVRKRRAAYLIAVVVALLCASASTILGTTWLAENSYCQPGTSGYATSYCPTGD